MGATQTASEVRRKFTVDDVTRMLGAGILDEDDRVELIEGELFVMSPQDPPHAGTVGRITSLLVRAYGSTSQVRVQLPLVASVDSLPEPDFAVVRGRPGEFDERHPRGDDAVLVVEVTWTSEAMDRRKAGIYARAGIPVYWRIDLPGRFVEVHENPHKGAYALVRVVDGAGQLNLPALSRRKLAVRELLPARARTR